MQVAPNQIFTGYAFDGTNITIPLAALPGLTAAAADPVTGNGMEVVRQVLERTQGAISALTPENRPKKAAITKPNPTMATGTGVPPGTLRQAYNATFDLMPSALELASEV